ncbi:MAG TPA: SDR family oxidoreductase [Pseudonocardia sp.]|jgi:NAD(P)-dependent dehydrogenase (short-subunit alcohol dehydrogenase family)|uniref:SDR family NAD(P)-dependent oxidoreductase n=1 Tax=Pseudonocardia sp. TaxID=60912 RepID=UPI002F41EFCB
MTQQAKIAIITGGNRGLGRDSALRLAEGGVDVIITYRSNEAEACEVVRAAEAMGRTASACRLDTSRVADIDRFADEVRALLKRHWDCDSFDFLVNNAGTGSNAPFAETTVDAFDEMVNVHFKGVYFLTQTLLPMLSDGGRIINISTGLTRFTSQGKSAYASVKGAVEVLTRYLAQELGPRGITVNTVAPGPVATDFSGGVVRDSEQLRETLGSHTALGRVGVPEDIGGVVAALLSGPTGWVTGQRIEASGGMLL